MAKPPSEHAHIGIIDGLRGIAALSVCWFHVAGLFETDRALTLLTATGRYGFLGVQVFFVISGFVIPFALHRAGYRLSMMGRFVAKRVARIDPPYLATIAIFLLYKWTVSHTALHQGGIYVVSWKQVLAHLGYLNAFIGFQWFLVPFWTLAIEFQYYLAMGFLFPWIARPGFVAAFGIAVVSGVSGLLLPWNGHLPHHLAFFAMGIAVFRRLSLSASTKETVFLLGVSAVFGGFAAGWLEVVAGLATALAILWLRYQSRPLSFLGSISYSLYLIHPIAASIVVNQGGKFLGAGVPARVFLLTTAMVASIVAAWGLYRCVELPSKKWAARIRYQSGLPGTSV